MRISVIDNLDAITSEELEAAIARLPQWRREQAMRFKHDQGRKECTYSYLLLCKLLKEEYGIEDQPAFVYGEHGKPSLSFANDCPDVPTSFSSPSSPSPFPSIPPFPDAVSLSNLSSFPPPSSPSPFSPLSPVPSTTSPSNLSSSFPSQSSSIHFNISHCRKAIACVVSDSEVGIDVECFGRYKESLARHICNDEELARIAHSPSPDTEFTCLWTQKEAVVKLTGRGIDDDLKNLLVKYNNVSLKTEVFPEKGYAVSVASEQPLR